ncbi:hypothetical protein [Tumebacillus permanentifrigoris]|uniref:Uncharacterized protein n=1 Tax=Tumebacillus permanentifrigoris TaxID=378543 RepID=A0A316D2H7_9BACL|nr:hypothetical protein [Tumebacillus permanentifrigoris]PWK05096.1 hypothetical protein C7459_12728 [Tumebacillus permanentifrigoris]
MTPEQPQQPVDLTPEDIVLDYLIGEHELEKLRHGFQAPVMGPPCSPDGDTQVPKR